MHLSICISGAVKSFFFFCKYFFGDSWRGRSNSAHYVHSAIGKFRIEIVYSYAYRQGNTVIEFNWDVKWLAFVFLIFVPPLLHPFASDRSLLVRLPLIQKQVDKMIPSGYSRYARSWERCGNIFAYGHIEENQTCDFDETKTEYFLLHKAIANTI